MPSKQHIEHENGSAYLPDIAIATNSTRNHSLPKNVTAYEAHFNCKPHYYYGSAASTKDTLVVVS